MHDKKHVESECFKKIESLTSHLVSHNFDFILNSVFSCPCRNGLPCVTFSSSKCTEHKKKMMITTCVFPPDYRGGFELHNAEEVEKESHLLEELEKLSLSGPGGSRERPHTSRSFTPLLDIPVDGYNESRDLRPPSASTMLPNWLLARGDDSRPPLRTDIGTIRSVHFDEVSLHSTSERGRTQFRNGHSKSRKEKSGDRSKETVFTLQSAARRSRPLLSQVFSSSPDQQAGGEPLNGHQASSENGLNGSDPEQEYKLKTVSISKTKQSLGKC